MQLEKDKDNYENMLNDGYGYTKDLYRIAGTLAPLAIDKKRALDHKAFIKSEEATIRNQILSQNLSNEERDLGLARLNEYIYQQKKLDDEIIRKANTAESVWVEQARKNIRLFSGDKVAQVLMGKISQLRNVKSDDEFYKKVESINDMLSGAKPSAVQNMGYVIPQLSPEKRRAIQDNLRGAIDIRDLAIAEARAMEKPSRSRIIRVGENRVMTSEDVKKSPEFQAMMRRILRLKRR
jgi:hypothetical protein